jgi:hypothetical protein
VLLEKRMSHFSPSSWAIKLFAQSFVLVVLNKKKICSTAQLFSHLLKVLLDGHEQGFFLVKKRGHLSTSGCYDHRVNGVTCRGVQ